MPNEVVFIKIEKPTCIAWYRLTKPLLKVVTTFESIGNNQTNITFRMVFDDARSCGKIRRFAPEKNEENFDKLENVLKEMMII